MNTQYLTTTTSPALPVTEELVDIPSERITGTAKKRPTLNEFAVSEKSIELLAEHIKDVFTTPGERPIYWEPLKFGDGYEMVIDWGVYEFTVRGHCREAYDKNGNDFEFDVAGCYDTVFDCLRPTLANRVNDYARKHRMLWKY